MKSLKSHPTVLALSILAALYTPAALAAPFTLTPTSLFSASFSFLDGNVDSQQNSHATNGVSAFSSLFSSNGDTSGFTFANPSGAYAVNTTATGGTVSFPAASDARSNLTFVLENSSAIAQNYFLTLKIYGGSLSTEVFDPNGLTGQEFLRSGYTATVMRSNTTTLFASSATLEQTASGTTLTRSGSTLTGASSENDAETTGVYQWDTDFYTIDLGVLNAGDFMQIDANLQGFSRSAVGTYSFDGNCGYEETVHSNAQPMVSEFGCFKGKSGQFYGDPLSGQDQDLVFSFDSRPADNRVPEPGSLLLAGGALGAAALVRRRRKPSSSH